MGTYINPGNQAFRRIAGADYVDKTGLINLINQRIGGAESLVCVSRPRRFGKSYAAQMLSAYYDCSCDSHSLFDKRIISRTKYYSKHLNQYNVIYLDTTAFISSARRRGIPLKEVPNMIVDALYEDILRENPDLCRELSLTDLLIQYVQKPEGKPFVFIIDEWDALIREAKNDDTAQERYLDLLREWFKNGTFTPKVVAAAYMTGILPIKRDGSQSAISDFREFSMLHPGEYAKYIGFSEAEVKRLCRKNKMDFDQVKAWYDGYDFSQGQPVYNPYSVMNSCKEKTCRSFWGKTSAAEALTDYINMNFDGLQETVVRLIGGEEIPANTSTFQNDFERFKTKDDILTLLVHLGYLAFDSAHNTVHIPNEEVRNEFRNFLNNDRAGEHWVKLLGRSRKLLTDISSGNEDAVALTLDEIRQEQYAPQFYNNEQALRAVIKYAFIAAFGQYVKIEEMPGGKGIADVAFIPAPLTKLPAMVVELKWDKTAGGAIAQIKDKHYTSALAPFSGNIMLVGINYDTKSGQHSCKIERV